MSFDDLRAFLEVARRGSFFAAAEALRTSRTTLRRQVDALEARAGVPLLIRSRNGVVPTEAGRRLVENGTRLNQEFAATLASVREAGREPAGELRMALPIGLHPMIIAILSGLMTDKWPQLRFHPRFFESPADAERMGVEAMLTFGGAGLEAGWTGRVVGTVPRRLLASREYLDDHGTPKKLEDLDRHDLMSWLAPGESGSEWPTSRGPRRVQPRIVTADAHLLHVMAHESRGIALVPDAGLAPMRGYEPLVHLLPDVVGDIIEVRVSARASTADLPRVRAVMEIAEQAGALMGMEALAPAPRDAE